MQSDNQEITISRKAYASIGLESFASKGCEGVNIAVEVFLRGQINPKTDLVVNLTDVDRVLSEIIKEIDHKLTTDRDPQKFARYLYERCKSEWNLESARVCGMTLYWGSSTKVSLQN